MRFTILRPSEPYDARNMQFASMDDMRRELPSIADCDLEVQAMFEVRKSYPDALPLPVPVRLGSGSLVLLGILPDAGAPRDPAGRIPCVMFVQAIPQNDGDRKAIKRDGSAFSRRLWRIPIIKPPEGDVDTTPIEIRTSVMEEPRRIDAKVFRRSDRHGMERQVLHFQVDDAEVSIELLDPKFKVGR